MRNKNIEVGICYKFKNKTEVVDFLKTADALGLTMRSGISPVDYIGDAFHLFESRENFYFTKTYDYLVFGNATIEEDEKRRPRVYWFSKTSNRHYR